MNFASRSGLGASGRSITVSSGAVWSINQPMVQKMAGQSQSVGHMAEGAQSILCAHSTTQHGLFILTLFINLLLF